MYDGEIRNRDLVICSWTTYSLRHRAFDSYSAHFFPEAIG